MGISKISDALADEYYTKYLLCDTEDARNQFRCKLVLKHKCHSQTVRRHLGLAETRAKMRTLEKLTSRDTTSTHRKGDKSCSREKASTTPLSPRHTSQSSSPITRAKPRHSSNVSFHGNPRRRTTVLDGDLGANGRLGEGGDDINCTGDDSEDDTPNVNYLSTARAGSGWPRIRSLAPSSPPFPLSHNSSVGDGSEIVPAAGCAASSSSTSFMAPMADADNHNTISTILSAQGIGHLVDVLRAGGFVSTDDLRQFQQLPELTKDRVLQEWKDSGKMVLKDWAKLHALIYSGGF